MKKASAQTHRRHENESAKVREWVGGETEKGGQAEELRAPSSGQGPPHVVKRWPGDPASCRMQCGMRHCQGWGGNWAGVWQSRAPMKVPRLGCSGGHMTSFGACWGLEGRPGS